MTLAAIDIGSNAARLLICKINNHKNQPLEVEKLNLIRIPLRLGFDVFETGYISKQKEEKFLQTISAFKNIMQVYEVDALKACATSAMRDAKNGAEIINKIYNKLSIKIEIISGELEAQLINENHAEIDLDPSKSYLYIDVGGGSTELIYFVKGKQIFKQSFNIGTIRVLKNQVGEQEWNEMKLIVKEKIRNDREVMAIGSGGNINKIFSISKKKEGKPLHIDLLKEYLYEMENLSIQQRIIKYKFKEDRADVIVPALQIYTNVMRWAGISEIIVPKIGLADGLIKYLYSSLNNN